MLPLSLASPDPSADGPARNLMNLREQYAAEMSASAAPAAKPTQEDA